MGIREIAVSRGATIHYLRRSQLHIKPGRNARDLSTADNKVHIEWLAGEIEAKGFTSVAYIDMDGGRPTITQGHCRMAAVDLLIERGKWIDEAKDDEGDFIYLIPVLLEAKGVGELEILAGQWTTNGSKELNTREAAANLLRVMALCGQDIAKAARHIGRSPSYVSQTLAFNEMAPAEVHDAIAAGEIGKTQAATILRKEGREKGSETIKASIAVAKAEGKRKVGPKHVSRASPAGTAPRLVDAGGGLYCALIDGHKSAPHSLTHWGKLAHDILDRQHAVELAAARETEAA